MTGKVSMETMQNIPIASDFRKPPEAIPHGMRVMTHTNSGIFQRRRKAGRINSPTVNAGQTKNANTRDSRPQVSYPNGDH